MKMFSLLRNGMTASKLTKSIVVEISAADELNQSQIQEIVSAIDDLYRTKAVRENRVIAANGAGGALALQTANASDAFSDCFIFSAELPDEAPAVSASVFYYIDITDKGSSYRGYENLFSKIRNDGTDGYEYRVRQGAESHQAFLNGLNDSFSILKVSLSR